MNPIKPDNGFEPEITAFYCIYCGYMAADTAAALHVQYPANVKFVRLPCSGKTDIRYILEAFEQGADGVYQVACPIGNCHHVRGNERGLSRIKRAKQILDDIGLGGERLDMFFMSGSQGQTFAIAAHTMTERIRKLGPSPFKTITEDNTKESEAQVLPADPENSQYTDTNGNEQFRGRK